MVITRDTDVSQSIGSTNNYFISWLSNVYSMVMNGPMDPAVLSQEVRLDPYGMVIH